REVRYRCGHAPRSGGQRGVPRRGVRSTVLGRLSTMVLTTPRVRAALGLVAVTALALPMAACGGKSDTGSGTTTSTNADSALAAKVPAAIKSDGKILVGSDTTYAPSEFLGADGKTAEGFD